jgi:hypothetical protein
MIDKSQIESVFTKHNVRTACTIIELGVLAGSDCMDRHRNS